MALGRLGVTQGEVHAVLEAPPPWHLPRVIDVLCTHSQSVLRPPEQLARGPRELTATVWPEPREGIRPLPGAHVVDVGQRDARNTLRVQCPARNLPESGATSQGPACNRPSQLIGKCVQLWPFHGGLRSCGHGDGPADVVPPRITHWPTRNDTAGAPRIDTSTGEILQEQVEVKYVEITPA
jgi:hypothetical protein